MENLNKINLFSKRHLGSSEADINYMLREVGYDSMSSFIDSVVPGSILKRNAIQIGDERTEEEVLEELNSPTPESLISRIKYIKEEKGYNETVAGIINLMIQENKIKMDFLVLLKN